MPGLAPQIELHVNGQPCIAQDPRTDLNAFIKAETRFKGVKLACGEGGCGACAVEVSRWDPAAGKARTCTINSCMAPVGSLDGCAVTTAEGLGNKAKGFHAIQHRFAEFSASQCGFCTPGMVVACHGTLQRCKEAGEEATPEAMQKGLDGNLCRCTGYRPIVDVCKSLVHGTDIEDLGLNTCAQPGVPGDAAAGPTFPPSLVRRAERLEHAQAAAGAAERNYPPMPPGQHWLAPTSLADLIDILGRHAADRDARLVAGNTSAGLYHEWLPARVLINTRHVKELNKAIRERDCVYAGANTSISQLVELLREGSDYEPWGDMIRHLERIAGAHVRNAATLGGHLYLGREAALESDVITPLLAAGASVLLADREGIRELPLEDFLDCSRPLDWRVCIVYAVKVPKPHADDYFWSHKTATRFWNSHALVNMSVLLRCAPPQRHALHPLAAALGLAQPQDRHLAEVRVAMGAYRPKADGEGSAFGIRRAHEVEKALCGRALDADAVACALEALQSHYVPAPIPGMSKEYAEQTAQGMLFAALAPRAREAASAKGNARLQRLLSVSSMQEPPVAAGRQDMPDFGKDAPPVGEPVEKDRARLQASGEALYTADLRHGRQELFAAPVESQRALARLGSVDAGKALDLDGVVAYVDGKDIPEGGTKSVFGCDLFATGTVQHHGQVVGLIVATSQRLAEHAAKLVEVEYIDDGKLGKPILSLAAAVRAKSFYTTGYDTEPLLLGDVETALRGAKNVIRGARYALPSQQHFYMEPHACVARLEEGRLQVTSSTQSIDAVQKAAADVLAMPCNEVLASVRRVGGAFGGKTTRPMFYAALCAVAAHKLEGQQVRLVLNRNTDLRLNGGRSETELKYDVGFDDEGRITALDVQAWVLAGAYPEQAMNDLMGLKMGLNGVYEIPHLRVNAKLCRTNLPPRTIVRGPGFLNAAMVAEQVLEHVAVHRGMDPTAMRELNFMVPAHAVVDPSTLAAQQTPQAAARAAPDPVEPGPSAAQQEAGRQQQPAKRPGAGPGDASHGQQAVSYCGRYQPNGNLLGRKDFSPEFYTLPKVWQGVQEQASYHERRAAVERFNADNAWRKRGCAVTPTRFDCDPPPQLAAVHVYSDGTVLVVHAGVELGQGLSTKVKQMACFALGQALPEAQRPFPLDKIAIGDTRSDVVPNGGQTWSSTASEGCVAAVQHACEQLVSRLEPHLQPGSSAWETWQATIREVHADPIAAPSSVLLSAVGWFNGQQRRKPGDPHDDPDKRNPLHYSAFGAAYSEVEIDVLTGEKLLLRSDLYYDCGRSLNPAVDVGQVEGAFVLATGMMTSEEVMVDQSTGALLSDSTWTYKIPSAACIPRELNTTFLKDSPNIRSIMSSKATGEPSIMLSQSVLMALRRAAAAARTSLAAVAGRQPVAAAAPGSDPATHAAGCSAGWTAAGAAPAAEFLVLRAPATTAHLKEAIGPFSIPDLLRAAQYAESDDGVETRSSGDLVVVR